MHKGHRAKLAVTVTSPFGENTAGEVVATLRGKTIGLGSLTKGTVKRTGEEAEGRGPQGHGHLPGQRDHQRVREQGDGAGPEALSDHARWRRPGAPGQLEPRTTSVGVRRTPGVRTGGVASSPSSAFTTSTATSSSGSRTEVSPGGTVWATCESSKPVTAMS